MVQAEVLKRLQAEGWNLKPEVRLQRTVQHSRPAGMQQAVDKRLTGCMQTALFACYSSSCCLGLVLWCVLLVQFAALNNC
jgi:hypothetical protein